MAGDKREALQLYTRGWRHAAAARARDPQLEATSEYALGFKDGSASRAAATQLAMKRLDITTQEAMSWVLR